MYMMSTYLQNMSGMTMYMKYNMCTRWSCWLWCTKVATTHATWHRTQSQLITTMMHVLTHLLPGPCYYTSSFFCIGVCQEVYKLVWGIHYMWPSSLGSFPCSVATGISTTRWGSLYCHTWWCWKPLALSDWMTSSTASVPWGCTYV